MFNTDDVYEEAVRHSRLHAEDEVKSNHFKVGSALTAMLLITGISYVVFKVYESETTSNNLSLIDKDLIVQIETQKEVSTLVNKVDSSEAEYLNALRNIESELIQERGSVNFDKNGHKDLSLAMNNLTSDRRLDENSVYTKELKKEIAVKEERKIIVKKGDTLRSISSKFYGDEMNYKRIIASNTSLMDNDTIYVGQTIHLPY